LIQTQCPTKQQSYVKMQKFSLHFPSPSLDLGKSLSITSTKPVLDMKRMCPFIFLITQSPFSFKVLDSFMTVHLQLFQILLLYICSQKLLNSNTVNVLAIWNIICLIFIHESMWSTYWFFTQILQKQASCKNKYSPWMDHFLAMGSNNQKDISIICKNLF